MGSILDINLVRKLKQKYINELQAWACLPDEYSPLTKIKLIRVEYRVGKIFLKAFLKFRVEYFGPNLIHSIYSSDSSLFEKLKLSSIFTQLELKKLSIEYITHATTCPWLVCYSIQSALTELPL